MASAALIIDPSLEDSTPLDRRIHTRIPVTDVDLIREVRLKYGPSVSLVDISSGGALLHTAVQLRPGTAQVLEIIGNGVEIVPFRVLRCQIAHLSKDGPIYRGACEFKRPIDVAAKRGRDVQSPRLDLTLKQLLLSQRQSAAAGGHPGRPPADALPRLLRSVQSAAAADDPMSRALRDVLSELVPALDRGEATAVLRAQLEDRLRRALPNLEIVVSSAPLKGNHGKETIYFGGGPDKNAAAILNVEMPAQSPVLDWQFRLLQASGYLLELLSSAGTGLRTERAERREHIVAEVEARRETSASAIPAVETPADRKLGWQKIVVRYRQGDLLKGYTHDFHLSRTQFSLWPSVDAAPSERVHVPTSLLKAVFFVRDFGGNPAYTDQRTFDDAQHRAGRRLEVTFDDGEVLIGSTLSYRPDGVGFFVKPADDRANNQRVFAVASAIRHLRFL